MSRSTKCLANQRGYTLIEVMMALTILSIGLLGVVALQTSNVVANQQAQEITTGTTIARTWMDRLRKDATRWNHPSTTQTTTNIGETSWLQLVGGGPRWIRPTFAAAEPKASPAFDGAGRDIALTDIAGMRDAVYCTHIHLEYLYPNAVIRAAVRVFWVKRRVANATLFGGYGFAATGMCTTGNEAAIGRDRENFSWVYIGSAISRVTAQ